MLAPLSQEFFLLLEFLGHPPAGNKIQDRSLAGRLLLKGAVHRDRLHVAVLVRRAHDIDVIIDNVVDEKGAHIAGAFPREYVAPGILAILAPVVSLTVPPAVTRIVKLRHPSLVTARFSDTDQTLFFNAISGHAHTRSVRLTSRNRPHLPNPQRQPIAGSRRDLCRRQFSRLCRSRLSRRI